MSDTPTSETPDFTPTASPGQQLKRERETQGLTREEIATSLNLRPAVIQGLEEDNYQEVPVAAYRRGYLRAYAHMLGIEDGPVLEAYRQQFGRDDADRKVTPVNISRPPSRLGTWLFRLVTVLVILGLIGLTLLWWQSRGGNEPPDVGDSGPVSVDSLDGTPTVTEGSEPPSTQAPQEETDEEVAPLPPLPEQESALGLVDEPDTVSPDPLPVPGLTEAPDEGDASGETPAETEPTGEEAQTADTEVPAEPAADPRVLELTFNEQSWTEIFDANNQRVFVGLQEPGTTARVEGEPPFRLTVGNATGVELVWRGESVDLGARAGANNVARFTLGE